MNAPKAFDQRIDVVELKDGTLAWVVATASGIEIVSEWEGEIPWHRKYLPWDSIPRAEDVHRAMESGAVCPFEELVEYLLERVFLPSPERIWAILLASWVIGTYFLDDFDHFPLILIEGLPERGKTRLGKAMIFPSLRGCYMPHTTPAVLFRYRAYHRAALLLDYEDLPRSLRTDGLKDLILNSFERDGKVPRVIASDAAPEKQIQSFNTYGPTVLVSNRSVRPRDPLYSRCIRVQMPECGGERVFAPVRPEQVTLLRAKLVTFSARIRSEGNSLPQFRNPFRGRLADISQPIFRVLQAVHPASIGELEELFGQIDGGRRQDAASTPEGRVGLEVVKLRDQFSTEGLTIRDLEGSVNRNLTRHDPEYLDSQQVGYITRDLGLEKGRGLGGRTILRWPGDEVIEQLALRFGVGGPSRKPSNPSEPSVSPRRQSDSDVEPSQTSAESAGAEGKAVGDPELRGEDVELCRVEKGVVKK